MDRYPLPGYLQHHTQPGDNNYKIRGGNEIKQNQYIYALKHEKKEHKI